MRSTGVRAWYLMGVITKGFKTKRVSWAIKVLSLILLVGCASAQQTVEDAAFLAARPILEKIFFSEAPITPSSRELYPTVKVLSGKPFNPRQNFNNRLNLSRGALTLSPGDYVVPVMTYCMQSGGSSPTAHKYALGKLSGRLASAIHDLNGRVLSQFNAKDVQVLSWSIQNGIPYEEMATKSKEIIDKIIPDHKGELKLSLYQFFVDKWNSVAETTGLPHFEELTDETLNSLGTLGEGIRAIRDFRRMVRERGYEYEELRTLVSLPGPSSEKGMEETTPWSQISGNVFARFLTTGHYLDIGQLQIRIVGRERSPQASKNNLTIIDVSALIADPGVAGIQPLSFSALSGALAVGVLPAEVSPLLVAAVIAALLAKKGIDWDVFSQAVEKFGRSSNETIQEIIHRGLKILSKEHDELEKPLRDVGIINQKTKDISNSQTGARNYENSGGKEAAQHDFEKIPGKDEPSSKPGVRVKTFPTGERAIYRPDDIPPTIEMQPKDAGRGGDNMRVKVRY